MGVIGSLGQVFYDIIANDKTGPASQSATSNIKNVGVGLGILAAGAGQFATNFSAEVNRAYLPFDKAMAAVKSLGVLSDSEFDDMQKTAIEWSNQYGLSATDIANAMYSMVSVGYDYETMLKTVPDAAQMAVGGNTSLALSMESVINVMAAYGEKAGSAAEITNILSAAVGVGKYEMNDLLTEMMKSIGSAANLGISFRDLATYSIMLQNSFVTAEEAGTSFNSMLTTMMLPAAKKQWDELGISLVDTNGKLRPLVDIMKELRGKLETVTDETERAAIVHKLFGTFGEKAALAIMREADSFGELNEKVGNTTFKTEAFNTVMASTSKQAEVTENRLNNLNIAMGENGLAKGASDAANAHIFLGQALAALPSPVGYAIGVLGGLASQLTSLSMPLIALGMMFPNIGTTIVSSLTGMAGTVSSSMGSIGAMIGGSLAATIAAGVAVGLAGVFTLDQLGILTALSNLGAEIEGSPVGEEIMNALKVVLAPIGSLGAAIIDIVRGDFASIPEDMAEPFYQAADAIRPIMDGIQNTVSGGISSIGNAFGGLGSALSGATGDIVALATSVFSGIGEAFYAMAGQVQGVFNQLMTAILGLITGTAEGFFNAGQNIIVSIVNGIIAASGGIVTAIAQALQQVRNLFPFSPAKEGPLAETPNWSTWVNQGMDKAPGEIAAAAEANLAEPVTGAASSPGGPGAGGGIAGGAGGGTVITIAPGAIVINGAGQNAEEIAKEVISLLGKEMASKRQQLGRRTTV